MEKINLAALVKESLSPNNYAVNYIKNCLLFKKPCSLIRLGDGEAKLLSYPEYTSREKLEAQLKVWFGEKKLTEADIMFLKKELLEAVIESDILGLPGHGRTFNKKNDNYTTDAINCQNLWKILVEKIGEKVLQGKLIVSANFHHEIQEKKTIIEIIRSCNKVGFISNASKLLNFYQLYFEPLKISFIKVPGETWSRVEKSSSHYPKYYRDICEEINGQTFKGELWWVGAGVLGKIYTARLAAKGAVAIDLGAILDGWNDSIPKERVGLANKKTQMNLGYLNET